MAPDDLDERIRSLVRDAVSITPDAPSLSERPVPVRTGPSVRHWIWVASAVVASLCALLVAVRWTNDDASSTTATPADTSPPLPTTSTAGGVVFLVASGLPDIDVSASAFGVELEAATAEPAVVGAGTLEVSNRSDGPIVVGGAKHPGALVQVGNVCLRVTGGQTSLTLDNGEIITEENAELDRVVIERGESWSAPLVVWAFTGPCPTRPSFDLDIWRDASTVTDTDHLPPTDTVTVTAKLTCGDAPGCGPAQTEPESATPPTLGQDERLEPGQARTVQFDTLCGAGRLDPAVTDTAWIADEAGGEPGWLPSEWRANLEPGGLITVVFELSDDERTLTATAAGRAIQYRPVTASDPTVACG